MYIFHYAYFRYHLYINKMLHILTDIIEMNQRTAYRKSMFYIIFLILFYKCLVLR